MLNQSIEAIQAPLTELTQATAELKAALAAGGIEPTALAAVLATVTSAAEAMSAIGPSPSGTKLPGLYETWSELVLALVALQGRDLDAALRTQLDQAIAAVRVLRRRFNLAPGGA
ncbi:MAG: hypothetical protein RLZZ511_2528 [Cyanobacteriota bacterium]|jgi:hypothetical protein